MQQETFMPDQNNGVTPPADEPKGAAAPAAPAEPSPGEKPADPKAQPNVPEEPRVPYARFHKVNERVKELEGQLAQQKAGSPPLQLTEEELADRQVKQYLEQVLNEREQLKAQEVAQETKVLEDKLDYYKDIDQNVDTQILLSLVDKYHLNYSQDEHGRELHPVDVAYSIWREMTEKEKAIAEEAAKKAVAKPTTPVSNKEGGGSIPVAHGIKSITQMAEEIKRSLPQ